MKGFRKRLEEELQRAFQEAGYEKEYGKVVLSNRPDLCEYQCNGAMAGAKQYKKPPIQIAQEVSGKLKGNPWFDQVSAVPPGFLNLNVSGKKVAEFLLEMKEGNLGIEKMEVPKKILIDYGGPNVAKPLHVGHLRSAIIGESIKRMCKRVGHEVIGDIHLGDWGYQMGLIITELEERQPDLPYFQEGCPEYPKEPPFTIGELEEIYPTASSRAKEDVAYRERALEATKLLQYGHKGYLAIWNHIMAVSKADLKKNYENLEVSFDWWKGESDAQADIPDMIERLKREGYAKIDEGALVIEVALPEDTKEVPPCMIQKSDGASLYGTTDLATLIQRERDFAPDQVIYVVDKRQELHFVQVFRAAKKANIVPSNRLLTFLGFGTMNGKDGKPFKTREGGVMRLESLIQEITEKMYEKISQNSAISEEEARETAKLIALSAIKYGDLSNQASKDYVFDMERFTSFEGNTGPYILYTIVRMKSILQRYQEDGGSIEDCLLLAPEKDSEKALMLELSRFGEVLEQGAKELAPHKLCGYIYELSNSFNRFYHGTKILTEENLERKKSYIALLDLTKKVLEEAIGVLGFSAPERM